MEDKPRHKQTRWSYPDNVWLPIRDSYLELASYYPGWRIQCLDLNGLGDAQYHSSYPEAFKALLCGVRRTVYQLHPRILPEDWIC